MAKAGDSWAAQARFWATEYRRRALHRGIDRLTPTTRVEVLHRMERVDAPGELDLAVPNPYSASCLVGSREVLPPAEVRVPADDMFPRDEGHFWRGISVHQLRDVTLDQETGLVFHHDRVLTASGHGWRSARDAAFLSGAHARVRQRDAGEDRRGAIAPMAAVFNYGHFLLESLPRLLHIAEVEPTALPVFPRPMPEFARSMLAGLGIAYDVARSDAPLRSDNVWLCDPTPSGWPHPEDLHLLRRTILDRLGIVRTTESTRLLVSRRGIDRELDDEVALERSLEQRGFSTLHPQGLGFREQVALFRSADLVVGNFGAGHANMIFMDEGSQIVDITTGEWWTPHFRNIARLLNQRYDLVLLPASPEHPFGRAADAIPLVAQALASVP